jgi:SAM-dependent methyltransferase
MSDAESTIRDHKSYFDREAADFDAIEKDPNRVQDPIRRLIYRKLLKLHEKNPRLIATLELAQERHASWQGKRVLELGCGHGLYSIEFAKLGANVVAVDYSAPMLELARQNAVKAGVADQITFVQSDIRQVRETGPFDLIFMTGVTDYLPKAVLKDVGGYLGRVAGDLVIVSFPPYSAINIGRWVWLKTMKRLKLSYYTRDEVESFGTAHGFDVWKLREIRGYYVAAFAKRGGTGSPR